MKKQTIVKGSLILGMGAFLAKFLGAIYRIPLTSLLKSEGLGLYQMIFPVYVVLLDFSGAGVPNALSKLVAENREKGEIYLKVSLRFFAVMGLLASLIMAVFAKPFSLMQGNSNAYLGYLFLAPAIFLVSILSCYRGYFQGQMNMTPTAISQIIEQSIKLILGLLFVYVFLPNLPLAVGGATLGITLSELVAFIYVYILYGKIKRLNNCALVITKKERKIFLKNIIRYAIPVTLLGIILPLSQVMDSFLALNIMGKYTSNATSLYGLLSGVAITVVSLPVSVCYGVSTSAVPSVAKCKSPKEREQNSAKAILLTFLLSLPCMVICYIFAPFIIGLLFRSLSGEEKSIAVNLLKIISPAVLLLSLIQTLNAIFIGKSKPYIPIVTMLLGVILKIVLEVIFYNDKRLNIYGGGLALIACYFFITLVNLIIMILSKVKNESTATIANYRKVIQ